ncbi:hypothetical protein QQG55_32620 [Brugia pahangi]
MQPTINIFLKLDWNYCYCSADNNWCFIYNPLLLRGTTSASFYQCFSHLTLLLTHSWHVVILLDIATCRH